jgi:CheY-like chemotaxis protein
MESLGVLAGGIAHDFNNLLTAARGHLSLARLALAEAADPARHLDHAEASIGLAADLARQLLAYSGRPSFAMHPLDLNQLIRSMASLLGVSRSKLAHLEVDLEADLPCIQADRTQIQQVIMNLVTNASEAIGARPGRIRLRTWLNQLDPETLDQRLAGQSLRPGPFVTLAVGDDGSGMGPEVLERIFDPFFTTKATGHGLGLSAIRGILSTHHAGIEVDSAPGAGTTVTLHFPAVEARPADEPEADAAAPVGAFGGGTLLLAEDEQVIRDLTTEMAERLGFQVLSAEDGEAAWQLFQAHQEQIRLAVLDLTMPRRSGAELYRLIRQRHPRLPILLCSGYSREAVPEAQGPTEPRTFLQKPFTFQQLGTALRELLDR